MGKKRKKPFREKTLSPSTVLRGVGFLEESLDIGGRIVGESFLCLWMFFEGKFSKKKKGVGFIVGMGNSVRFGYND